MTKQEEIYKGLMEHLGDTVAVNSCEADLQIVAGVILKYLHSQGVVIRTPANLLTNEYYANNVGEYVEPLIEESK